MKIPKKILGKTDYIKHYIRDLSKFNICEFCKYNKNNYTKESTGKTLIMHFLSKCHMCKYSSRNSFKTENWIGNCFKPLYEWEKKDRS